jgi:hypothetical protein
VCPSLLPCFNIHKFTQWLLNTYSI